MFDEDYEGSYNIHRRVVQESRLASCLDPDGEENECPFNLEDPKRFEYEQPLEAFDWVDLGGPAHDFRSIVRPPPVMVILVAGDIPAHDMLGDYECDRCPNPGCNAFYCATEPVRSFVRYEYHQRFFTLVHDGGFLGTPSGGQGGPRYQSCSGSCADQIYGAFADEPAPYIGPDDWDEYSPALTTVEEHCGTVSTLPPSFTPVGPPSASGPFPFGGEPDPRYPLPFPIK